MSADLHPVVAKARSYLRASTATLTAAFVLVSVVLVVLQHQNAVRQANFDSNSNVHVITIGSRVVDDTRAESLSLADLAVVRSTVRAAPDGARSLVSPRLALGASLIAPGDEPFAVVGLDPEAGSLIGTGRLADDVVYTTSGAAGPLKLDIPVITSSGAGGMSSDATDHVTLTRSPTARVGNVTYLEGRPDGATYVSVDTFWSIAQKMLRLSKPQIERAATAGELPMIPLLSTIYVDVPDLQQVRPTAAALERAGYGVDFALRAFDAIERDIWVERSLGALVALLTLGGAAAYVVISWRSYLRLSRRDLGILRHWRVEPAQLEQLYARQLRSALTFPLGLALIVTWVGSVSLFGGGDGLPPALLATAVLVTVGALLYAGIRRLIIRSWSTESVLPLLRSECEFQ